MKLLDSDASTNSVPAVANTGVADSTITATAAPQHSVVFAVRLGDDGAPVGDAKVWFIQVGGRPWSFRGRGEFGAIAADSPVRRLPLPMLLLMLCLCYALPIYAFADLCLFAYVTLCRYMPIYAIADVLPKSAVPLPTFT